MKKNKCCNIKKNKCCFGISSKTQDNKHIVFIDADIPKEKIVDFVEVCQQMQKTYVLSDLYIISTKNGFNAFTLDKLELELITNILYNYPMIDELFIYFNNKRKYYTLRYGDDKEYLFQLKSKYNVYDKSNAHRILFSDVLNIPIDKDETFDDNYIFELIAYENEKHGIVDLNGR